VIEGAGEHAPGQDAVMTSTCVIGLLVALAVPAHADAPHQGLTFDVGLGLGLVESSAGGCGDSVSGQEFARCTHVAAPVAIAAVGIGGWARPNVAVTARLVGTRFDGVVEPTAVQRPLIEGLVGLGFQYWLPSSSEVDAPLSGIWLGAGLGVSFLTATHDDPSYGAYGMHHGLGFEGRLGYSVGSSSHAIEIALEGLWTPIFFDYGPSSLFGPPTVRTDVLHLALIIGYQFR
jgi:hypothetical protein